MQPQRHFLFLQGPHGPFFAQLSRLLAQSGARISRIGFNPGDRFFWPKRQAYTPFGGLDWPGFLTLYIGENAVSDIVLYGDSRAHHAQARAIAQGLGLRVHCFEEGYLRPFWATYERDGVNGNSALMHMDLAEIRAAIQPEVLVSPAAPAQWGALRHHIWYGFLYHLQFLRSRGAYGGATTHREHSVLSELRLHARRLVWMPLAVARRRWAAWRFLRTGAPYFLGLLQLGHDASLRSHSEFTNMRGFVDQVIAGFAAGAPGYYHLVFKAHPLEDGREGLRAHIDATAKAAGLHGRVHYQSGGRLGQMLDHARGAVTVNSTAAQQALWRGLPVRALGRAIYSKPDLVSDQDLAAFFASPKLPDRDAYADFRQFLLQTSQFGGGFYTAAGRAELLRVVTDRVLAPNDPYATPRPLPTPRLVSSGQSVQKA